MSDARRDLFNTVAPVYDEVRSRVLKYQWSELSVAYASLYVQLTELGVYHADVAE